MSFLEKVNVVMVLTKRDYYTMLSGAQEALALVGALFQIS
jgi:hypothetical protein